MSAVCAESDEFAIGAIGIGSGWAMMRLSAMERKMPQAEQETSVINDARHSDLILRFLLCGFGFSYAFWERDVR